MNGAMSPDEAVRVATTAMIIEQLTDTHLLKPANAYRTAYLTTRDWSTEVWQSAYDGLMDGSMVVGYGHTSKAVTMVIRSV